MSNSINSDSENFYVKYLKYKNKYLQLKLNSQRGGNTVTSSVILLKDRKFLSTHPPNYLYKNVTFTKCDLTDQLITNTNIPTDKENYLVISERLYKITSKVIPSSPGYLFQLWLQSSRDSFLEITNNNHLGNLYKNTQISDMNVYIFHSTDSNTPSMRNVKCEYSEIYNHEKFNLWSNK
jgi:hypothetical protein